MLALAACGSDGSASGTNSGSSAAESARPDQDQGSLKVQVPKGSPPKRLVIEDLEVGTGPAVKPTDEVAVQYVGAGYETGKEFDAHGRSEPFRFQVGVGQAMPGFDRGVIGMKLNGRRRVIIPPKLTYYELGDDETLVYAIELLEVETAAEYEKPLSSGKLATLP